MNSTLTSVGVVNSRAEQDVQKQKIQREAQQVRIESAGLTARIKNSSKLSDGEKNALLGDVALVSKFAQGSFKKSLLSSITATTLYIERFSSVRVDGQNTQRSVKPIVEQAPPSKVTQANVEQSVQKSLERVVQKATQSNVNLQDVQKVIPKRDVEEVLQPRPTESTFGEVKDVVVISSIGAKAADVELPLPGGGEFSTEVEVLEPRSIPASPAVDYEPIPLPGESTVQVAGIELLGEKGDVPLSTTPEIVAQSVDVRLPGEGAVAQLDAEDLQFTPPTTVKFA